MPTGVAPSAKRFLPGGSEVAAHSLMQVRELPQLPGQSVGHDCVGATGVNDSIRHKDAIRKNNYPDHRD